MTYQDDDLLGLTVWCVTCQHTHVSTIPVVTYACGPRCGFGVWDLTLAERHATDYPDHLVHAVRHQIDHPEAIVVHEWRVTGEPGQGYPTYQFVWRSDDARFDYQPERHAREFMDFFHENAERAWDDGPHLTHRTVTYTQAALDALWPLCGEAPRGRYWKARQVGAATDIRLRGAR